MKKIYFLLLSCSLFIGCNNNEKEITSYTKSEIASLHLDKTKKLPIKSNEAEIIDLNNYLGNESFDFMPLIKSVHLIPLESNDNSLVANIYKIVIEKEHIYIYDDYLGGGVLIFTHTGKFIKRIPNGSGPGELYKVSDITFNQEKEELLIYQHPHILYYTKNGDYITQKKLPFGFYNFESIGEHILFKTLDSKGNQHLENIKYNTLLITDQDFKVEFAGLKSSEYKANYGGYHYLNKNGQNIQIVENNNDTIFHYNDSTKEIKASYILNYNKKKLPKEYWNLSGREFTKSISNNNYFFFIGEYFETHTHHAIFLRNNYLRKTFVYFRDKTNGKIIGGCNAKIDIEQIPPIAFPKSVFGNYFVSVYYPNNNPKVLSNSKFISSEEKVTLQSMTEDDNPILVLYDLNNFTSK